MSILVSNLSLPLEAGEGEAVDAAFRACKLARKPNIKATIYRKAIDTRRQPPRLVWSVVLSGVENEEKHIESLANPHIKPFQTHTIASLLENRQLPLRALPPVVAGLGPAGLFAALLLARAGQRPLVIERGLPLPKRDGSVASFWTTRQIDGESNVQFGEGGAGAYSDGKLTTRINDALCDAVLDEFAAFGAPADILQKAKPHIGTDKLKPVVQAIREEIQALGGTVLFQTKLEAVYIQNGKLEKIRINGMEIPCDRLILAIGHSARDTWAMLHQAGIWLQPKGFAVGVRIEHRQETIDQAVFGAYAGHPVLGAAEYRLSFREGKAACYSFCMCPGGTVVAAASEAGGVVVNGMSDFARSGPNANAALIVPVEAEMFPQGPLGGAEFARKIEQAAFDAGGGNFTAPMQTVGDFLQNKVGSHANAVMPTYPLGVVPANLAAILPAETAETLAKALPYFGKRLPGFDEPSAVLTAPETRTSSPVRIVRNEDFFAPNAFGLIPCGEGAGYAGGIMSAAVDGLRCALSLLPWKE